jgi:hypothetical protein
MPQFTLRDLFWLMLVAALVLTWSQDHRRLARERTEALIDARSLAFISAGHSQLPERGLLAELQEKYTGNRAASKP